MNRRGFLGVILAAGVAPAFVRYGSLMVPSGARIWLPGKVAMADLIGGPWVTMQHYGMVIFHSGNVYIRDKEGVLHQENVVAPHYYDPEEIHIVTPPDINTLPAPRGFFRDNQPFLQGPYNDEV